MSRTISIYINPKHDTIQVDAQVAHLNTLHDLREYLRKHEHTNYEWVALDGLPRPHDATDDFTLALLNHSEQDTEQTNPEEEISLKGDLQLPIPDTFYTQQVVLKLTTTAIFITHAAISLKITTVPSGNFEMIKAAFYHQAPLDIDERAIQGNLSYQGQRIMDYERLRDIPHLDEQQEFQHFMGKIKVTLKDETVDTEHTLFVSPYETIKDLKKVYVNVARRVVLTKSTIKKDGQELDNKRTIADCNLKDHDELEFTNPAFKIRIREDQAKSIKVEHQQQGIELEVFDGTKIAELKDMFGQISERPLVPGDRLLMASEGLFAEEEEDAKDKRGNIGRRKEAIELEDNQMVYKYLIHKASSIWVERARSQSESVYLCNRCGNDVRLKRADPVICRTCGNRILLKTRSTTTSHIFQCI